MAESFWPHALAAIPASCVFRGLNHREYAGPKDSLAHHLDLRLKSTEEGSHLCPAEGLEPFLPFLLLASFT